MVHCNWEFASRNKDIFKLFFYGVSWHAVLVWKWKVPALSESRTVCSKIRRSISPQNVKVIVMQILCFGIIPLETGSTWLSGALGYGKVVKAYLKFDPLIRFWKSLSLKNQLFLGGTKKTF